MRIDLGLLTGYGGQDKSHYRHVMSDLPEHPPNTYAEQLLAEFQTLLAELDGIILDAKTNRDMKTYFEAIASKTDVLKAKSRAFGVSPPAGRPRGGRAGKPGSEEVGEVDRGDISKVVRNYQLTNGESGAVLGAEDQGS